MNKRTYWISLPHWMELTVDEHRRLDDYCRRMNMELGIDVAGYYTDVRREQEDFQKDRAEYSEEMGLGGRKFRTV